MSVYRREPVTDEDIAAAVAEHVRLGRPPKRGAVFCGDCRDAGCPRCLPASPPTTAELLGANISRLLGRSADEKYKF